LYIPNNPIRSRNVGPITKIRPVANQIAKTKDMELFASRDANAFQEFIMEARMWWGLQMFPTLLDEYRVASAGRQIKTPEDVAAIMQRSATYRWFCFLERHIQKEKYSANRWGLVEQWLRESDRLDARLAPGTERAAIDPNFRVPEYYARHDIHQHPGNLHGAPTAGVVYEASALSIHPNTKKNELHERFVELVKTHGAFDRILDMGCGFGKSTVPLARAFPQANVMGIDVSAPCLQLAAADSTREGLANIDWRQADLRATNLPDASFDLVTSTMVLHELPPPEIAATLRETHRLLCTGGVSIHLDFRTDDPFWQFIMYGHGLRNNEPYLEPLIRMDLASAYREAGFDAVTIDPFAEREGATAPDYPYWRFPWVAVVARKSASNH
jgi:ubiquinone/menaquinone biosynthesis C-methylase UbiE